MKTILSLLLVVFSFISYILLSRVISHNYYHPVIHYLGMLAGIGLLIWMIKHKFTKARLVALCFSMFFIGFFAWYTNFFSAYDNNRAAMAEGDIISDQMRQVALASTTGAEITLGDIVDKNEGTLVVFVRAEW
ncbi:MAG: hypothetical protein CVU54_02605 [Deltaproteobacteria bacterium HGW-Deltaproteobacteria-12]|jgi:hypothetical protein|nr:MAG: hypothetical protein CVU54_02605 [Deltaproteobacteria bacterium HGW-Deltaproteobacteria-12]